MALLTEMEIRNAKARDRAYKLFDERGLFLLVTPTGGRLWRFRYRIDNREKLLSLGIYPDVPLKRARETLRGAKVGCGRVSAGIWTCHKGTIR